MRQMRWFSILVATVALFIARPALAQGVSGTWDYPCSVNTLMAAMTAVIAFLVLGIIIVFGIRYLYRSQDKE